MLSLDLISGDDVLPEPPDWLDDVPPSFPDDDDRLPDLDPFDFSPPRYFCHDEVVRRYGQPLAPVIWQGKQWCVSTRGIEARDGRCIIDRTHLWDDAGSLVAGNRSWVDRADFIEAVRIGRRVFPGW